MKKIALLILITITSLVTFGQDTLFMRTGEVIKAKIIEVNETNVSYKKSTYLEGPTFIVLKSKIAKIIYADGSVDYFMNLPVAKESILDSNAYGRNILAVNPLSLIGANISFSYERISKKGKFGFRVPVYFAYAEKNGNENGLNLDFKFYFGKKETAKYYLGPSLVGFGAYQGYFNIGLMVDNGISLQPFKKFNITIDAAAGIAHTDALNTIPYMNVLIWRAGINLGLRF